MKTQMLILGSLFALAQMAAAETLNDAQVAKVLKTADQGEITQGRLALSQTSNKDVKHFAKEMIDAHSENLKEARKAAKQIDSKLANSDLSRAMEHDNGTTLNELQKATPSGFDKAYVSAQIDAHQKLLNDLDGTYIPNAQNDSMRDFLKSTREHVQAHLTEAQELQTKLQ